ncbi:hypothetical protein GCM10020218_027760 [Dactylosporangium vinaceum]
MEDPGCPHPGGNSPGPGGVGGGAERIARAAATTCETVVYTDIRTLVTIDLDTATDTQVRILANQILSARPSPTG